MSIIKKSTITMCLGTSTANKYDTTNVIDENGNVLVFCKELALYSLKCSEQFNKRYNIGEECIINDFFRTGNKLNVFEWYDRFRIILDKITDEDLIKILECLPKLKNGSVRSTKIPLVMSGVVEKQGDDGWCRITSYELSVAPWTISAPITDDPKSILARNTKLANTFYITFTNDRNIDKHDKAIIELNDNNEFKFNQLTYERKSYIDPMELVPGTVYKDNKEREWLYLGAYRLISKEVADDISIDWSTGVRKISINEKQTFTYCDNHFYSFYNITDKNREIIKKYNTFLEYIQAHYDKIVKKKLGFHYIGSSGFKSEIMSLKMTEEVQTLFTPEQMYGKVEFGFSNYDKPYAHPRFSIDKSELYKDCKIYENKCTFEILRGVSYYEYTVHEYSKENWRISNYIFTTTDRAEANAKIREMKKLNNALDYELQYDLKWRNIKEEKR